MERRKFLGTGISGTFLLGAAGGAAAGTAGTLAIAPYLRGDTLPFLLTGIRSYAQQGEDIVLHQILRNVLGIEYPTYMDIGAHHPIFSNNTYFLYERRSRGVLVEPNPALHDQLEKLRPRDVLVRAGIGVTAQTEADYYVIGPGDGQLNTFSREQAETLVAKLPHFRIERVMKIPLLDINELMLKHWNGPPNLLSLDTEGFDLPILRSLDFKRLRPDVICVETQEIGGRRQLDEIPQLMAEKGYDARGATFVNTIFIDRRHIK
jgi:FkbM family methyltransferase